MPERLVIVINGTPVLEYDRAKPLAAGQEKYLEELDAKLRQGLQLNGQAVNHPDALQRAQFVALQLLDALHKNNESTAAAACAYLATRRPELRQLRADESQGAWTIDLVQDRPYIPGTPIRFTPFRSTS